MVALLVVALAGAALLWADFHAARSETRAESSVTTMRSSAANAQVQGQGSISRTTALRVEGDGGVESRLRDSLPAEMERRPSIGNVVELQSPDHPVDTPAMLVHLAYEDTRWTPVHATAAITATFVYASNGDLTWRNDESIGIDNEKGVTVLIKGEIRLSDATSGVISLRAYERKLGEALAAEVSTRLEGALRTPAGGLAAAERQAALGQEYAGGGN
jgi:hypothetical protein